MRQDRGFTLLELMVALLISSVLTSACFMVFNRFQLGIGDIRLLAERDQNLWIAPVLLVQWLAGAGNNRHGGDWEGVYLNFEGITIRGDIDGDQGFPDGLLDHSFEDISLRQSGESLVMRSGSGFYQPVLKNIDSLRGERVGPDLLAVHLGGSTSGNLAASGESSSDSFEVRVHLWNYRTSLFKE